MSERDRRRRKRKKKQQAKRGTGSQRSSQRSVHLITGADLSRAGSAFVEAASRPAAVPEKAWDHLERMMEYEIWLSGADDEDNESLDINSLPTWYHAAARHSPEAFEFVRHHSFAYVSSIAGLAPWSELLMSILRRAFELDPDGAEELLGSLDEAHDRFLRQYQQATKSFHAASELEDTVARLRVSLQSWAAIYETDVPLWLLGVLGQSLKKGSINSGAFGGPLTATAQSSLVNSIGEIVEGTPLEELLTGAYDPDLRNTLAHNDYEILVAQGSVALVDHRTSRRWSGQELWELVMAGQHLVQSTLVAIQTVIATSKRADLRTAGVTTATYGVSETGLPIVVLSQLWCCRDLDPRGSWLDGGELKIRRFVDGDVLMVGSQELISGDGLPAETLDAIEKIGWASVQRLPVAPTLESGLPTVVNAEGEELEVVGPPDHHVVPIAVVTSSGRMSDALGSAC